MGWGLLLLAVCATPWLRASVVRHTVPYGEPLRTVCESCARPVGRLPPTGRCPGCRERIGPAPYALELVTFAVFALLAGYAGAEPALLPALGWAAGFGVVLGFVDVAVHRLPDALTLRCFVGSAVLLVLAALLGGSTDHLLRCAEAALALGALYGAMALVAPIGLGDAKLAPTLGAVLGWYGWSSLLAGLFYGFVLGGLWGVGLLLTGRAARKDSFSFGPFMLLGALLAVLAAQP